MATRRFFSRISLLPLLGLLALSGCVLVDLDDDGDVLRNDVLANAPFTFEVPVTSQTRLRLEAINGTVDATGVAGATGVRLTGERRVGSDSRRDAEDRLNDLTVFVEARTDEVFVRTEQPRDARGRTYVVDYTITVPARFEVRLGQINGNVAVSGGQGNADVELVNGNVRVGAHEGSLTVQVVNGTIEAQATLPPGGVFDLATTNGNLSLDLPRATSAQLSASVTNGTISTSGLDLQDVVQSPRVLRGRLGAGDGVLDLRTINGNITLRGF